MTSHKCPKCGLVSFTTTGNCKRCYVGQKPAGEAVTSFEVVEIDDAEPRRPFSPLRVLLLILLIAIPGWLYYQSQQSAVVEQAQQEKKAEREAGKKAHDEAIKRCRSIMDCP